MIGKVSELRLTITPETLIYQHRDNPISVISVEVIINGQARFKQVKMIPDDDTTSRLEYMLDVMKAHLFQAIRGEVQR